MFWWVVGFEVQVSKLMFRGTWFSTGQNKHQAAIETQHVFMLVCFEAYATHAWKPTPGHLEMNNTFTTCHWNNIGALKNVFPKMASKLSKSHEVKFSNNQTLLMNNYTPNDTLNTSFAAPSAICTTMGSSTSSILTPKFFVDYRIMKEFVGHESKRQQTPLSLIIQFTIISWRFCTWHLPWPWVP
jgi:hypothetical protein